MNYRIDHVDKRINVSCGNIFVAVDNDDVPGDMEHVARAIGIFLQEKHEYLHSLIQYPPCAHQFDDHHGGVCTQCDGIGHDSTFTCPICKGSGKNRQCVWCLEIISEE